MTIFFVAAHDEATNANLAIAIAIAEPSDSKLFGTDATRANLLATLSGNAAGRVLFAMSHGSKDAILDSNKMAALATTDSCIGHGDKVFAWACHTGARLGLEISRKGATWWGYDCAVTAPDERSSYAPIFASVFKQAKSLFLGGINQNTVNIILDEIKKACEDAIEQFDNMSAYDDSESFAIYSCCGQIWQHLSVFLPSTPNAIRHPNAPPAYIDL